jgi:hypothetical protein
MDRGSAFPVTWKVLHANVAHARKPEWIALLRSFSGLARIIQTGSNKEASGCV